MRFFLFQASSSLLGLGVVLGNLMDGIPLNENKADFVGSLEMFFRPFPILIGIFTVSLLMVHGSVYLAMKTEGALHNRLRSWAKRCMWVFVAIFAITSVVTWVQAPHLVVRFKEDPFFLIVPILALLAILNVPRMFARNWDGWAFLSSCASIVLLFGVFGIGTFPYLVRSTINPEANSLLLFQRLRSSALLTLNWALLIIVGIGIPLVLAYGTIIYRIFRGKVKIDKTSY